MPHVVPQADDPLVPETNVEGSAAAVDEELRRDELKILQLLSTLRQQQHQLVSALAGLEARNSNLTRERVLATLAASAQAEYEQFTTDLKAQRAADQSTVNSTHFEGDQSTANPG